MICHYICIRFLIYFNSPCLIFCPDWKGQFKIQILKCKYIHIELKYIYLVSMWLEPLIFMLLVQYSNKSTDFDLYCAKNTNFMNLSSILAK